jgi:hypothetical protein
MAVNVSVATGDVSVAATTGCVVGRGLANRHPPVRIAKEINSR